MRLVCQLLETCGKASAHPGPPRRPSTGSSRFSRGTPSPRISPWRLPTTCERRSLAFRPKLEPHADYQSALSGVRAVGRGGGAKGEGGGRAAGAAAGARHEDVGLEGIAEEDDDDDDETDGEDDESSDSESEADELADDDDEEGGGGRRGGGGGGGGGGARRRRRWLIPVNPSKRTAPAASDRAFPARTSSISTGRCPASSARASRLPDKRATNQLNAAGRVGDAGGPLVGPPPPSGGTVAFRMLTKRGAPRSSPCPRMPASSPRRRRSARRRRGNARR